MASEQPKILGQVAETVDDRLQCIALEHGLSREEALGWVMGIGMTVLEVAAEIPDGKLVLFSGSNFRRITLPSDGYEQ